MGRKPTEQEIAMLQSFIAGLEDALEMVGNSIVNDIHMNMMVGNEEENLAYLKELNQNLYRSIKTASEHIEGEYEAFRNDPEVQAQVDALFEALEAEFPPKITYNGDSNDDEGNGNLQ